MRPSERRDRGAAHPGRTALSPKAPRQGQALQRPRPRGRAHKRYACGCKVSLGVTSRGGWIVAAQAREGNPYDGHTLQSTMDQMLSMSGKEPEHVYADMNYRGHDYQGESQVHVDSRRRGSIAGSVWRWMKRRAAIE